MFHLQYSVTYRTHRFIDLSATTPEQLDQLAAGCNRATFGHGDQDVYDESYRKALEMNAADFAAQFDPAASGLIKAISDHFFRGQAEKDSIRSEVYKLNVYGLMPLLLVIDLSERSVTHR